MGLQKLESALLKIRKKIDWNFKRKILEAKNQKKRQVSRSNDIRMKR